MRLLLIHVKTVFGQSLLKFNLLNEVQFNTNFFVNILTIYDKYVPFQFLSSDMRMNSPIKTWAQNCRIAVAERMVTFSCK